MIDGEPLLSRVTTLTGEGVRQPGNFEVLLGTPVRDLLVHGGVDPDNIGRLVMGGPMMGFTLHNPAVPVVKTTNCIIAATLIIICEKSVIIFKFFHFISKMKLK